MIITIDGPAGSGKGTIAEALAKKYKMAYFDTGMVYRAVGLQMVLNGNDLNDTIIFQNSNSIDIAHYSEYL